MVTKTLTYEDGKILEWKWASDHELIPSPFFTSIFFVDGILIDAGPPAGVNDFKKFIHSLLKDINIKLCVITHTHEDHSGGAHMLKQEFNIPVYAPKAAIEPLRKDATYPQYRQITWGEKRKSVQAQELPETIRSISETYQFEVFPMPGHASEQITLIEKDQEWVFAADAIQPKYKMLFGASSDIQEDMEIIYSSLKKLYEYTSGMDNLKIFLSGPGVYEGRGFIKEKIEEIEALHKRVHRVYKEESEQHEKEEKILRKVLKRLFKRESAVGRLTDGDLSIMNLIKSLLEWPLNTS
ncbi:MAG: MBL fold metallo-hydrolase [Candidatus Lokiarchaeota archaeon]|nr:MBL fold metallo-hydrolase [Candidatus Lokiarchaeota archaeon]